MLNIKRLYDTSSELTLYRYNNGIGLLRPDFKNKQNIYPPRLDTHQTVADILQYPFSTYFTSKDSVLQCYNEGCQIAVGLSSLRAGLEKRLDQMIPRTIADKVILNNNEVIKSKQDKIFEEFTISHNDQDIVFLTVKSPWYDKENKIIGTFGCSIALDGNSSNLVNFITMIKQLGLLNSSYYCDKLISSKITLNNWYLSQRETEVMHYIARGKSAKQTAKVLEISPRTVEQHLENIKIKVGVSSKSDLISKVIDEGGLL
jgi:DNA-binding CsgD family transcriptional regulator